MLAYGKVHGQTKYLFIKFKKNKESLPPAANFLLTWVGRSRRIYHLWVRCLFFFFQNGESCADSLSVCVIYSGAEHHGGSVAEGAVRVCCGSLSVVSQLADRAGPQGAAHQRSPIHQPDRPSWWKGGWGSPTVLGSAYPWNKNSVLSVCLSLPLMSECFINKREPRRLPPLPVSSV